MILLWDARTNLAALHLKAGRQKDAILHYRKGIENLHACWAVRPKHHAVTIQLTSGYMNLARALADTGEAGVEEALLVVEEGLDFVVRRIYEEGGWTKEEAEERGIAARADLLRAVRDDITQADEEEEPPK